MDRGQSTHGVGEKVILEEGGRPNPLIAKVFWGETLGHNTKGSRVRFLDWGSKVNHEYARSRDSTEKPQNS